MVAAGWGSVWERHLVAQWGFLLHTATIVLTVLVPVIARSILGPGSNVPLLLQSMKAWLETSAGCQPSWFVCDGRGRVIHKYHVWK